MFSRFITHQVFDYALIFIHRPIIFLTKVIFGTNLGIKQVTKDQLYEFLEQVCSIFMERVLLIKILLTRFSLTEKHSVVWNKFSQKDRLSFGHWLTYKEIHEMVFCNTSESVIIEKTFL